MCFSFFPGLTDQVGLCLLIVEVSGSHSDTPQSVGLLWTSDWPIAETSTCTTHNTHNRQTSILPAAFQPAIPTSEQPQTYALEWAAIGTSHLYRYRANKSHLHQNYVGMEFFHSQWQVFHWMLGYSYEV